MCSDVVPEGVEAVEGKDLSGEYFEEHSHVVRIQLARGEFFSRL